VAVNLAAAVVASQVLVVANQVWLPWQVVDKRLLDKLSADRLAEESGQPVPAGLAWVQPVVLLLERVAELQVAVSLALQGELETETLLDYC
jgi:hypothetical protein